MPLTDMPDLMEQFDSLFTDAKHDPVQASETASTFVEPAQVLAAPPVPLADLLDPDGSIISRSLRGFAETHCPDRIALFEKLTQQLLETEAEHADKTARIPDFVYPVI